LRRADYPSKESYQMSKCIHNVNKLNSESEQAVNGYALMNDDEK